MPPFSTLAYFMSKNCGPESYRYVQKWQNLTKTLRHVLELSILNVMQIQLVLLPRFTESQAQATEFVNKRDKIIKLFNVSCNFHE